MKGIYKKQIWEHHTSYNEFEGKPMIESIIVEDDHQSDYYNIYNKSQVNTLIKDARSARIVPVKPTNPMKNTMYYVGANPPYDVYFYTSVRKEIYMGKTSDVFYMASEGLEITPSLDIKLLHDPYTLSINSKNELIARGRLYTNTGLNLDKNTNTINVILAPEDLTGNRLDVNANNQLYIKEFEPATDDSEGKHGVVPAPATGDNENHLRGDGTWRKYNKPHLIGEVRMFAVAPTDSNWMLCDGRALSSTTYPELFKAIGTTYGGGGNSFNIPNLIGKSIEGAGNNVRTMLNKANVYDTITIPNLQVGAEIEAGMPNITGTFNTAFNGFVSTPSGAFIPGASRSFGGRSDPNSATAWGSRVIAFNWQNGNGVWSTTNPNLQFNSIDMPYYIRVK